MMKKIIAFSSLSTPAYIAANAASIEAAPIDGVIFNIDFIHPTAGTATFQHYNFSNYSLDWASLIPAMEALKGAALTRVTNNFPLLNVRPGNQDWFDTNWLAAIVNNFQLAARFCAKCNLPGFMFDAEEYQDVVWDPLLVPSYPAHSVAEHRVAATSLGFNVGVAVQREYPNIKIFLTIPNVGFLGDATFDLYSYFLNGLADGISPHNGQFLSSLVSGEENTYSALTDADYLYYDLNNYTNLIGNPDLSLNYLPQQSKAFSVSPQGGGETWDHNNFNNNHQTPTVFQQMANVALALSGEYAWVYSRGVYWYPVDGSSNLFDAQYVAALKAARVMNQMQTW